jgi:hypothetical protein
MKTKSAASPHQTEKYLPRLIALSLLAGLILCALARGATPDISNANATGFHQK